MHITSTTYLMKFHYRICIIPLISSPFLIVSLMIVHCPYSDHKCIIIYNRATAFLFWTFNVLTVNKTPPKSWEECSLRTTCSTKSSVYRLSSADISEWFNSIHTNWLSALIFAKSGLYIWKAPEDVVLWNSTP